MQLFDDVITICVVHYTDHFCIHQTHTCTYMNMNMNMNMNMCMYMNADIYIPTNVHNSNNIHLTAILQSS